MPPLCLNCHVEIHQAQSICETCWQEIDFISTPICKSCGYPFETSLGIHKDSICPACIAKKPDFDMARAALNYNDTSRDLLMKFKHGDQQHITPLFVRWLHLAKTNFPNDIQIDYVVPIPLHRKRLFKRRYNQAALLAKSFARDNKLVYRADLLLRIKATETQGHLSYKARHRNLRGAFKCSKKHKATLKDKSILILDDVYTTGSTANEAAKVLRRAGAKHIYVLTVARVPRPQKVD